MGHDLLGAECLLSYGRSPDEQFDLLRRLGCLMPASAANRMAVVLLLDRVYQEHVDAGYPPSNPTPVPGTELLKRVMPWIMPAGGELPQLVLATRQCRALAEAGFLDPAACRADDVQRWWSGVVPVVAEIYDAHNPIFAAIATPPPPLLAPEDGVSTLVPSPYTARQPRTDPITCPTCGRPMPRSARFCVWCGRRLEASGKLGLG